MSLLPQVRDDDDDDDDDEEEEAYFNLLPELAEGVVGAEDSHVESISQVGVRAELEAPVELLQLGHVLGGVIISVIRIIIIVRTILISSILHPLTIALTMSSEG